MTTARTLLTGDVAPDFSLAGDDGKNYCLADLRGRRVVLYFYPRDSTPGCTQEACDFRDQLNRFGSTVVFGVSPDSIASHQRFRAKYDLPFVLLSDPGAEVAQRYGAYGEKVLYGKKSLGIIRSTFVIDESGRLAAVYGKVSVKGHVERVLHRQAGRRVSGWAQAGRPALGSSRSQSEQARGSSSPTHQHRPGVCAAADLDRR